MIIKVMCPNTKNKYLTVYDYQTGGVWQYVYAESKEDILKKYPALKIVDQTSCWLKELDRKLREYDINDEPDSVMKGFTYVK